MTSEDPDRIIARIREDVPVVAERLESLAAELRLLSDSLSDRHGEPADADAAAEADADADADAAVARERAPAPAPEEPPPVVEQVPVAGTVPTAETLAAAPVAAVPLPDLEEEDADEDAEEPSRAGLPKFFAVAGSAVALVGVALVLLLPSGGALGGQLARTAVGLVLAALAVGAAIWQHRLDPDNVGARALLATGIASALLCVLGLTVRFVDAEGLGLLPVVPGLAVTALVAIAGLWGARSWSSQGVAIVVTLGGLLVAPLLGARPAGSPLAAVAAMVVVTLVAGLAQLGRGWVWLLLARTAPTVLYVVWVAASPSIFRWGPGVAPAVAIGLSVLLTAMLALGGLALAAADRSRNWQERVVEAGGLAALATPLLVVAQTQETRAAAALACLVVGGALLAAVAPGAPGNVSGNVRVTALPLGVLFLLLGLLTALDRQFPGYLPWGLAAAGLALAERSRSRPPLVAGSLLGVAGLVWWAPVLPVLFATSYVGQVADQGVERVVQSLLGLAVAAYAYRAFRTFFPARRARVLDLAWSGAVVVGAVAVVLAGSLLGSAAGDAVRGFQVAHVLVTIGLGVLCIVLVAPWLQGGHERPARARLAIGLAVTVVAKLFLFDTHALPALWRAGVFIVVGVLLLVVGTWYYRQLEPGRRTDAGYGQVEHVGK